MKHLLLLTIIIAACSQINAQIKATTETGNTVVLYPNGTWKYYEAGMDKTAPPTESDTKASATSLHIDTTIFHKSERFELFYEVSPKMARYFGEEKGKIRCHATFINNHGQVQLAFEINVPVGDGNRYFGKSLAEQTITLTLLDNHEITIPITENTEVKLLDKWNQSYFVGAGVISDDNLKAILRSPVENLYIDWKKNPETYKATYGNALQKALIEIL